MILTLRFVTVGDIDPVALRTTVYTAVKSLITANTLLQTTDHGQIQDFQISHTETSD